MPTTPAIVFSEKRLYPIFHPEDALMVPVGLSGASLALTSAYLEYTPGVLLGELTATPGRYAPYNPAAADGSQNPKALLVDAVTVDGSNVITWAGDQQTGITRNATPAFFNGIFGLTDLIGLDANALSILQGAIVEGVIGTNEQDTITLTAATNTFDVAITTADSVVHNFNGNAGNITAAALQALIVAVLGVGSVKVTLSGLIYTLTFGGALGNQAITVGATGHTITATAAQVTAGAAATVASGQKGIVRIGL